jgi:CRISPR-associated protein Cst1
MGIATLTAFSERNGPEQITANNLEQFAKYAEEAYFSPAISGYLTVLFTANFVNPSWNETKKRQHVRAVLTSYRVEGDLSLPPCTYCGRPSIRLPYLNPSRGALAYRDLVPMLSGEKVVNFFPDGHYGLFLCGFCVLALQALAIGAPLCEGRALVVSSDNPNLVLGIVRAWLPEQRARIQLSQVSGQKPPKLGRPRTRTIEAITDLEQHYTDEGSRLAVYLLSNSGQGPSVDIHELPATITSFIIRAKQAKYRDAWKELVQRAWERPTENASFENERPRLRNYLYEDLFGLPEQAGRFARVHFLRRAIHLRTDKQASADPRTSYGGWRETECIRWNLTELFLKEVIGMERDRIKAIRQLGDRVAEEIATSNDRRLWWDAYTVQSFGGVRNLLIRQSRKTLQSGREPLISFDSFLTVFEEGDELARVDWKLAWDLVLIRLIEQLHIKKWFDRNREVLELEEEKI